MPCSRPDGDTLRSVYFTYVDETGIDGLSPLIVMTGIVVNSERLTRTQDELASIFTTLEEIVPGNLKELKSSQMLAKTGPWRAVDGQRLRNVITNLCDWLVNRKHDLAWAAIEHQALTATPPPVPALSSAWPAAAMHIALQLQRCHQDKPGSKGRVILVFDDNQKGLSDIGELVFAPPTWTDAFYSRKPTSPALSCLIDTPFAVKSHHVGLVQVADIFAAIFRRHAELAEYGHEEKYAGEAGYVQDWVSQLQPRLLAKAHRWPSRAPSPSATWYRAVAPSSLLAL